MVNLVIRDIAKIFSAAEVIFLRCWRNNPPQKHHAFNKSQQGNERAESNIEPGSLRKRGDPNLSDFNLAFVVDL